MGIPVLIYGKSGSGKSRSLKNFGEDEIFFVNVEKKPLPFRKKFKYTLLVKNYDTMYTTIQNGLEKMPTKTAVIDDAGYLIINMFMSRHNAGLRGNAVFELYNDIADKFWGLIKFVKDELPDDIIVYILMHEDTNDAGQTKLRTIGKLLDDKVCVEGMVTISLRCIGEKENYYFRTKTDGFDITKTPEEMFDKAEIENDLKAVDDVIRKYYDLKGDNNNEI